jgi:hypothetical protein
MSDPSSARAPATPLPLNGDLSSAGKASGVVALGFQVSSHSLHNLGHRGVDVIDGNIGDTAAEVSVVEGVVGSLGLKNLVLFLWGERERERDKSGH